MPIPDYQTIMLPLLRSLADGQLRPVTEFKNSLATCFGFRPMRPPV
ncbi:MAG TPA: hypothetical protein VMU49_03250 [Candidatus Acidoferrales bacterium]|nr:hypothetical protein [Candidatus Acidoferrales bacterium]